MKGCFLSLLFVLGASPARAQLQIFACEPEWAALAEELGGDRVEATSAVTGLQDVHYIQARPSLIARVRRVDLVISKSTCSIPFDPPCDGCF